MTQGRPSIHQHARRKQQWNVWQSVMITPNFAERGLSSQQVEHKLMMLGIQD